MKPHVAVIVAKADSEGSVAEVARRHAGQLSREFDVTLLSDSTPPEGSVGVAVPRRFSPITFPRLRRFRHVPDAWGFWTAARKALIRLHREKPVSLAWCHSHPVAAWGLLPLKKRWPLAAALTVHGDIFLRPRGTYDFALTALYKAATPRAYAGLDIVHLLHPSAVDSAVDHGARRDAILVAPNGIRIERFGSAKTREEGAPLRLLFAGRLAVEKNPEFLLHAAGQAIHAGCRLELACVGGGPLLSRLRETIRKDGLENAVRLEGACPASAMPAWFAWADVVCLPSLSDTFPTTALESLASGTPVAASGVEGLRAIVDEGRTGWLLPQDDAGAWADLFLRLDRNRSLLRDMEKNCRESSEKYSWDAIGRRLADAAGRAISRERREFR